MVFQNSVNNKKEPSHEGFCYRSVIARRNDEAIFCMKICAVYILTNITNRVLYVGVTSNLPKRIWEHKNNGVKGFTEKYHVHKLVYFETTEDIESAIQREKQLKGGSREKKLKLIESMNPGFEDLYNTLT